MPKNNMAEKMQKLLVLIIFQAGIVVQAGVPDLDERFLEQYKTGKWLIEFYAPWCGHCKKLEPIYHQVHRSLINTDIHVAKIDATRYSYVASEFDVRGFPTIKFFNHEKVYTFRGERTGEDIISFVNKAQGPPVRHLTSVGKFNEAKTFHKAGVFFLYVGDNDPNNDLFKKYDSIAQDQVALTYFYASTKSLLPESYRSVKTEPTILVFKDNTVYEYEAPRGVASMTSLLSWINGERYPAFPLVSGGNINEMADTGKLLVIFIIDENDSERKEINTKVKEIGRYLAVDEREKYHSFLQFLWMDDPETANNIMLAFITLPYVLVLDPTIHMFYIPETPPQDLDAPSLGAFLEAVKDGRVAAMGGTGFFQRIKRLLYDLLVTVLSVWQSSRWLFLIMFGLPTAVISIVCYSLCCMETVDDETLSDDEDSDEEYRQAVLERQMAKEQKALSEEPAHEKAE